MSKILTILISLIFLASYTSHKVYAADLPFCYLTVSPSFGNPPNVEPRDTQSLFSKEIFTVDFTPVAHLGYTNIKIGFIGASCTHSDVITGNTISASVNPLDLTTSCGKLFEEGKQEISLFSNGVKICNTSGYIVKSKPLCATIDAVHDGIGDTNSNWTINATGIKPRYFYSCFKLDNAILDTCVPRESFYSLRVFPTDGHAERRIDVPYIWQGITSTRYIAENIGKLSTGSYESQLLSWDTNEIMCRNLFNVGSPNSTPPPTPFWSPTPTMIPTPAPGEPSWTPAPTRNPKPELIKICEKVVTAYQTACKQCMGDDNTGVNPKFKNGAVWTAIGCLPVDMSELLEKFVFLYGTGIAGGVAFLYFLYGCFLILTSTGNPERIEEAKQIIVSSIAGLLLIIFSITLLSIIGVEILQLPGFGK